jgi:proline iminopeptidase
MVLRGVFLGSQAELEWFLIGLRRFVPEAWNALTAQAPAESASALLRWFAQRVDAGDAGAARRWSAYESAVMAVGEAPGGAAFADDASVLARVRVQLHYLLCDCFLAPDELIAGMPAIAAVPAIIVQGRRDLPCPPLVAHRVHAAWPGSELRMIEEGGHSAMHPAMSAALVRATQDLKSRVPP